MKVYTWRPKDRQCLIFDFDLNQLRDFGVTNVFHKPLVHVKCHSPDGFNSGYSGPGPSDLALSILTDYLENRLELCEQYYRAFRDALIIGRSSKSVWTITSWDIENFLLSGATNTTESLCSPHDSIW
jgi:hypothetical protein